MDEVYLQFVNTLSGVLDDIHTNPLDFVLYCNDAIPPGGIFAECGVHTGHTIRKIARAYPDTRVYGFDSFHGLPESWNRPDMTFTTGFFSTDGQLPNVPSNVTLIPGWFDATLPAFASALSPDERITLVHIDCDIYSSTKTVLTALRPVLHERCVLVFDELVNYPNYQANELKALYEFLVDTNQGVEWVGKNGPLDLAPDKDTGAWNQAVALRLRPGTSEWLHKWPRNTPSVEVVIARFAEDIDWVPPFLSASPALQCATRVSVFNKGPHGVCVPNSASHEWSVSCLPNVGREGHTYLHWILANYGHFPDVVAFLPASLPNKKVNPASCVPLFYMRFCYSWSSIENFSLDEYSASDPKNRACNGESVLQLCPHRPFRAWFQNVFNKSFEGHDQFLGSHGGAFVVYGKQIMQHPKSLYERLLSLMDGHSNPEAGHYLERSWRYLFEGALV